MQYPLYEGDIRLQHPDIPKGSGGKFIAPEDYVYISTEDMPENTLTTYVYSVEPVFVNGIWKASYIIKEYTSEEIEQRNEKLSKRNNKLDLLASGNKPSVIE